MDNFDDLIGAIDNAEGNAYGSDSDGDLSNERAAAIDYYLGRNVEPAPDGRSQLVDRAVYETIAWMKPSLSRIFASGDDVVQLPPVGPEDEEAAKQEGQYLNYIVMQKNNWFDLFNTCAHDALLTKAGYLYTYHEKRRQVELEKYERQTEQGVALIMQDKPEVLSVKEYPDPDYEAPPPQPVMDPQTQQPVVDPMSGQPVMQPPPPPTMLYDLEIRRTKEQTKYCIEALPPERCKISKNVKTVQLRDSDYFEYWDTQTISQLRQDGYEVEEDIGSDDTDTPEDDARDQYSESMGDERVDPAMRQVKVRWIWIRFDQDEDGIAELQYVVRVGRKILHREEVNRIPVAVLCPDPLPHRHIGLCPADSVIDIQRAKTAILRQGLDNLYLSNNQRTYVNPSVINLDDMLVSRPGGVIRGKGIFGQDIAPMPVPFIFPQAMEGLEYMDQIRENRTGTNRYFTGIDQNSLNKTASGQQALATMAAQRVEQIARYFANGVEELFAILHEVILKSGHQREVVKLRGKWVPVNPAEWSHRSDFKISVGYAAGNKDAQTQRLMMIASMQEKAMAGGLPIVKPENVYETALEITKSSDLATPERFWTDPATVPPPEPPQPDVTVMAAEKLKSDTTLQTTQAELQSEERRNAEKLALEKYKADLQAVTDLKLEESRLQHATHIEHFKGEQATALEKKRSKTTLRLAKAKGDKVEAEPEDDVTHEEAEALKSEVGEIKTSLSQVLEAVQQLSELVGHAFTAKRQIKRGKDGRPEGVDILGNDGALLHSQRIERGADGRIAGSA